jgi:DDE superfamily endonuclease
MNTWQLPTEWVAWIASLSRMLHGRIAWRLQPIMTGMLFAQGRRTVSSWLRAAGVGKDFRPFYYFLGSLGRKSRWVALKVLLLVLKHVAPEGRLRVALDDSPTKRAGPWVQGAGVHHNPTPGAAGSKFLYGHVWVTLAVIATHPQWGAIALPVVAALYVRAKDFAGIDPWNRWPFQTKLQLGAELVEWVLRWVKGMDLAVWVAADGAYAKRPFLKRLIQAQVTVVSRLRKDAALWSVPAPLPAGQKRGRGRPRKYGKERIRLAIRAGHPQGWMTEEFTLYRQRVTKTYKTFLATYRPVGGLIRVVIVKNETGWRAYFCTNPEASVAEILEMVADRGCLEQAFHDIKEVHGAGEQQVRHIWANVAVYHLNLWLHTFIELWAWDKPHHQLCDRSASPWDDPTRRPSHADRRNALRRECLRQEFSGWLRRRPSERKIRRLCERLLSLAA